ncbi:MFS transporter [Amycolatopsis sp. NPDC051071]|uniref:MFS transporter n=1 Tax=Amycolatopsis sp. NPDC051071 TaxID=3154637 RepID=UPI0034362E7A
MYLSTVDRSSGKRTRTGPRGTIRSVGGTVVVLGTVSLLTDISSEMVTAVLPLYFVLALHVSPVVFGLMDGLYTGATALLRLVGGYVADRFRRRKAVAGIGYGISALAKLALAAVTGVPALGAVLVADRAGKGLRTAPRDALISLSVPESMLGRAFGVHRAMDSAGAFAGPLVALGVLAAVGTGASSGFTALFFVSFCIAASAVLVLMLFARDRTDARTAATSVTLRGAMGLMRGAEARKLLGAAAALGLSTVGDGFVYLILVRQHDVAAGWFPLFAVVPNVVYLVLAGPFGALADRVGRRVMLRYGYAALAAVYLLLTLDLPGIPAIGAILVLYGVFYAATDGVLMALAGPCFPAELRTTGLACVQTVQALAYFASSVAFGLAWAGWGAAAPTGVALAVALLACGLTWVLLPKHAKPGETR